MKKSILIAIITLLPIICLDATASQVQSALPPYALDFSVTQLALVGAGTSPSSPIDGPSAIKISGHSYKQIHLGTNSDLYTDQNNIGQFWVSYTLDTSSNITSKYSSASDSSIITTTSLPITGTLWLSLNTNTQTFGIYSDKIGSPSWLDQTASFSPEPNQSAVSTLIGGTSGYPAFTPLSGANASVGLLFVPCIECNYVNQLNLSFLEFRWNGNGYDLFTSAQGFDQVFSITSSFTGYTDQYAFNIAPVPAPAAALLFGSSIFSLFINARKKSKKS